MNDNQLPFLKWAGGKRWLTNNYLDLLPKKFNTYLEPFVGSGAVFFKLNPKNAIISDKNKELILTYEAIKQDWLKVEKLLKEYNKKHSQQFYYDIRSKKTRNIFTTAAKFIYLNRTCWNGLYRVNKKGQFNVPIGSKTNVIFETDNFENISNRLINTTILHSDFEEIVNLSKKNDFIFVDPPYTVKHNNNGFIKYNEVLFEWKDQIRLYEALVKAKSRGTKIILTNAHHESIKELYQNDFKIITLERHSIISSSVASRGKSLEYLIQG